MQYEWAGAADRAERREGGDVVNDDVCMETEGACWEAKNGRKNTKGGNSE